MHFTACGLFEMAENQFDETKVNDCSILLLYFPFHCSRQEGEIALSEEAKTKPNPRLG